MTPFPAPTAPDDLLSRLAELRAGGASWEAAARDLDGTAGELRAAVAADRAGYRRAYNMARRDVLDEAFAEALFSARRQLRADDDKDRHAAAALLLKMAMSLVRHRDKPGPRARVKPGPALHPRFRAAAESLSAMTEQERADLFVREMARTGWRPPEPDDGDELGGGTPADVGPRPGGGDGSRPPSPPRGEGARVNEPWGSSPRLGRKPWG